MSATYRLTFSAESVPPLASRGWENPASPPTRQAPPGRGAGRRAGRPPALRKRLYRGPCAVRRVEGMVSRRPAVPPQRQRAGRGIRRMHGTRLIIRRTSRRPNSTGSSGRGPIWRSSTAAPRKSSRVSMCPVPSARRGRRSSTASPTSFPRRTASFRRAGADQCGGFQPRGRAVGRNPGLAPRQLRVGARDSASAPAAGGAGGTRNGAAARRRPCPALRRPGDRPRRAGAAACRSRPNHRSLRRPPAGRTCRGACRIGSTARPGSW